jgi:hypothetical protein
MSQRKLIRHAIVDLLMNKTAAEDRVYPNRLLNVFELELPAILVYTKDEPVRVYTEAPREYERLLNLSIEIVASATDDLDDLLDDVSEEIEYWMRQDHTHGELCADTTLKRCEISIQKNGDSLIGSSIMSYEMPYYTEAVRDSKDLRPLHKANVKIHMHGDANPNQIDSEDLINAVTG